jgi:phosphatidylglycerophosphate synthase
MRTLTSDAPVFDQREWRPALPARPQPWSQTLTLAALGQVVLLILLARFAGLGPVGAFAALSYTAMVCVGLALGVRRAGADSLGPADKVTLARSALVGCVTALVADMVVRAPSVPLLVGLTVMALALDGVDGWVARRTGTSSELGARFDMEVDAFLILVLSANVAMLVGFWVLAIGLMRYLFMAAGRVTPWLRAPIPPTMPAKVVAAAQGVVLVVATARVLPPGLITVAVAVALAALAWSFGRSVLWLWNRRRVLTAPSRPVNRAAREVAEPARRAA